MLEELAKKFGRWLLEEGEEASIVFSSRIRLARNIAEMPFSHIASAKEQKTIISLFKEQMGHCPHLETPKLLNINQLDETDRQLLVERFLTSKELIQGKGEKAIIISNDELISLMINEEDHLRIQSLRSGLQLREAWSLLDQIDTELNRGIRYAFDKRWGYLTACPTNTGTALRASVMLHLPALLMTKRILELLQTASRLNLAIRGLHGEGSETLGDFFQISNQSTLGQSEEEIIETILNLAKNLIDHEKKAREDLLKESSMKIEDKVGRAVGILTHAKLIGSKEAMDLLSALRLGLYYQMVPNIALSLLNQCIIEMQPAHLQKRLAKRLDPLARDMERANLFRQRLSLN